MLSPHGVDECDEYQAANGGYRDGAHHLDALLGRLLGPFGGLQDTLGVVECKLQFQRLSAPRS